MQNIQNIQNIRAIGIRSIAPGISIAFDNAVSNDAGNVSSATIPFTCSGTNRVLLVGFVTIGSTTDIVNSVTYNSVAMTRVDTASITNERAYLYILTNPASGANNLVISLSGSEGLHYAIASYTGAKQSGQPDNHTANTATQLPPFTTSLTPVLNSCWTVLFVRYQQASITAGVGTTARALDLSTAGVGIFDSNRQISPPASNSLQATSAGGSGDWVGLMASIAHA